MSTLQWLRVILLNERKKCSLPFQFRSIWVSLFSAMVWNTFQDDEIWLFAHKWFAIHWTIGCIDTHCSWNKKTFFYGKRCEFLSIFGLHFFIHLIATSRRQTLQDVIFFATMLQMKLLWLLYRTLAHDKTSQTQRKDSSYKRKLTWFEIERGRQKKRRIGCGEWLTEIAIVFSVYSHPHEWLLSKDYIYVYYFQWTYYNRRLNYRNHNVR